ncbi:hypothetical protein DERF_001713 [Dermatophagoides farinae]|uniref:Uncharacterized protein n=1 Tax=Dermatophagoides farinae TaxID=6954 RepID=A0A922IA24_DERFA|nr:hypothetical protein DERF_001713 [Dermatophagoides farinae]
MIIGGQIPGRTIEQNLTSEARDGFAMSWRSAFRAKPPNERSCRLTVLRWSGVFASKNERSANGHPEINTNINSDKRLESMNRIKRQRNKTKVPGTKLTRK